VAAASDRIYNIILLLNQEKYPRLNEKMDASHIADCCFGFKRGFLI